MHMSLKEVPPKLAAGDKALTTRVPGLDLVRFFASLCVVAHHTAGWRHELAGNFRMPFYATLLTYLVTASVLRNPQRSWGEFIRTRVQRVLVPFFIWIALYSIPTILQEGELPNPLNPLNFFSGLSSIHLWFLPFAFYASILARVFAGLYSRFRSRWIVGFALGALCAWSALWAKSPVQGFPWDWWTMLFAPLVLGVVIAPVLESPIVKNRLTENWRVALGLCMVFLFLSRFSEPDGRNVFGILAGLLLLTTGIALPAQALSRWAGPIKYLGQLSYGVYLIHFEFCLEGGKWLKISDLPAPLRFLVVVIVSMVAAAILQRARWGRFMLGMEPVPAKVRRPVRDIGRLQPAKALSDREKRPPMKRRLRSLELSPK
jgi:peptidoglycan/LPS O-acetylase OafA/YrhL